jgi:MFS family permease
MADGASGRQVQVAVTSFVALFAIVGLALYGLPFYYDFMVREFGWSRAQVTSGNAISKLIVGPLFGFAAGWVVDRFGPRRLMMAGIVMAGGALIGLAHMSALWMFYLFYLFNAIGYVCGGPLPNQVLLSRWFDKGRGKAMGFAYLGIGVGGYLVLRLSASSSSSSRCRSPGSCATIRIRRPGRPVTRRERWRRWAASSATRPSTCWRSAACARSARSAAPIST